VRALSSKNRDFSVWLVCTPRVLLMHLDVFGLGVGLWWKAFLR
jgi:hypothetical protein